MSFIKFVVDRATVERAMNIPLIADYVASQGVGDLIAEFARQHPNYSFADLLGEFGIEVTALPVLIKDFVLNHFSTKHAAAASVAATKTNPKPLTYE